MSLINLVTFSLTYSSKYSLDTIAAPRCFCPCTVTLMDVSLKGSLTLSSLAGFVMVHHFLSLGKKPKSGPRVVRASHLVLIHKISIMEPASITSSANQHCFTMGAACRLVIKDWMLKAYIDFCLNIWEPKEMTDISEKCWERVMKEQFQMDKRLLEQENSLPGFRLGPKYFFFFWNLQTVCMTNL